MIYLAQTDTTAGFLSKDLKALNNLKKRPLKQDCLITTAKFSELKKLTRVPSHFKNTIRKSKKTTFLYPNFKAIRVVKGCAHEEFLKEFDWLYSTSANIHGKKFDLQWAMQNADKMVDEKFFESGASKIFKLRGVKKVKLR
ncbi:Sua5 YciO YrdC YwlC family protein [Campylobacter lari]|nr:Sua5 YciO YrdC YwlC family protein [Campylobacter lari]EAJ1277136.1 Sua5 YciO YrdC YwlC family protein [Campylobacter lari]EAJ5683361.1 Sua5 YciO YrdC YwlC family protein [Campylobacter lari]EJB6607326.1 Sua5 YciO YrdC YwlC family protein [Campylobacter lari]EJB6608067.1 Sua5 YciO YrdC YwlC family protein [Campylobacter lari]